HMLPEHSMYTVARLLSSCVWVALFGALFQPDSFVFATETKGAVPRPQDHVSYYGHKQVQEGDDFIIHCFVSKGTNVSWTKDGWPLRSLSQSGAYTVSEYTQGLQVSRLQVWNAEPYHSGVYSCSERSSASHVLEVSPRSASRPDTPVPNESLHLECGLAGTKNVAWYKDGKPLILSDDIFFDTGTTLEIKHATERDAGVYGCADSHGKQQAPIANELFEFTRENRCNLCVTPTAYLSQE
ncbi:obscurin, putative, partial [Ixodes scapularis]